MWGAGEQGKGSTLKARRESGRGASYRARTTSRRVVPQDLGEGLQRGHGASKPSSTEELGVGEDPVGLKLIESKGPWARVEEPETGGSHAGRQQVGGDTRSMAVKTGRAEGSSQVLGAIQNIVVGSSMRDTGASGAPSVGASETRLPNGGIKT